MGSYSFHAADLGGKKIRGVIEASSFDEAKEKLRRQSLFLLEIRLKKENKLKGLSRNELYEFVRELSDLLSCSLPLYECLVSLEEKHRGSKLHPMLSMLVEKIKGGSSLSSAMQSMPGNFDPICQAMVETGEASGDLAGSLQRYGALRARELKLRKDIGGALLYPALLLTLSMGLLVLFLLFLVPSLEELFSEKTLSPLTAFVFGLSRILRSFWPLLLAAGAGVIFGLVFTLRQPRVREKLEQWAMRTPYVKRIYLEGKLARLTRLLATLLKGDVSLVDALKISKRSMGSALLEKTIGEVEGAITEGGRFSRELARFPYFPPLFLRMVSIGEEGGVLGNMLEKLSLLYEDAVEKRLQKLTTLLPPIFLLGIGVWIALIVMAILLPLTDVSTFLDN